MSSILDALKRLDQEDHGAAVQDSEPSWLDAPPVRASLPDRISGFFLSRSLVGWMAGAAVVVIAGAAILAASGMITKPAPESAVGSTEAPPSAGLEKPKAAAAQQRPPADGQPEAKNSTRPAGSRRERASVSAVRISRKPVAEKTGPSASLSTAQRGPGTSPERRQAKARPAAGRPFKGRSASTFPITKNQSAEPVNPAPAAEMVPRSDARPNPAGSEPKDDPAAAGETRRNSTASEPGASRIVAQKLPPQSGLQLQAVSWAEEPQNRIVVINGRILREGERIEDYVLSEIHRDDVLFEHAGQRWKLEFRQR